MLDQLVGTERPLTYSSLATACGLHPNTVREHLDALLHDGLVRRSPRASTGRGRPAWLYEATPAAREPGPEAVSAEYAGLASALASALAATSANPVTDAARAGRHWGRALARDRGASGSTSETARSRVLGLLDDLGFGPEPDPEHPTEHDLVRLTSCPLLTAAREHPDVVCAVHLGLVRGALAEQGTADDDSGSEDSGDGVLLHPFDRPGSCGLVLPGEEL